ncbi:peptide-methionine (S)-S-oxide reductase [Rubritalea squalenifaciens DSM 18772]|uniref:Peptide methionine sulfoxide reductase MsrA n=2 Tax=Rubritalea squalenifaciens TaxID=407226 RepID=A0A1M6J340_9BACT|nr:peptide-methionine (S)-S-oxide reductase [Rubritalea squalenifaciens DSM 18772]
MMKLKDIFTLCSLSVAALFFSTCKPAMSEEQKKPAKMPEVPEGFEQITLGAGCFWCVEAVYNRIDGVKSAVSGYMGGKTKNPTYEEICTGSTGHAEVVHVTYDPKKISTEEILAWFWQLHDPTTLNRQGNDVGTQYRSAIYYYSDKQKDVAEKSLKEAQKNFKDKIVTEITKASELYPAEVYHQDYYRLNKNSNGYCRLVIAPKMKKLKLEDKEKVAE